MATAVLPGPIVRRALPDGISDVAAVEARHDIHAGARGAPSLALSTFARRVAAQVRDPGLRALVCADAEHMVDAWVGLTGNEHVRITLTVIRDAHCPKVHVDHLDLRILSTYSGPGTLVCEGEDRTVLRGAETGDFVYLAGTKWSDGGIYHRSPPLEGEPRLLLRVDGLV